MNDELLMTNMTNSPKYDLLTIGRSSIDLYSQNIGAPFEDIKGFDAFVGGSPLNIAVGAQRLGLRTAILTGVGEDKVGDFILNFLQQEQVSTEFIPRVKGARSSAVILGIEPPNRFPLVYYRDNAADMGINIEDVECIDMKQFKAVEVSATALSREPSRSATFYAAERANESNIQVILDIDFRADQWHDIRAFGVNIRAFLKYCTLAIGTNEEVLAAVLKSSDQLVIKDQQISAPEITGDLAEAIKVILASGIKFLVLKSGKSGCEIHHNDGEIIPVSGFPVEVLNILGAGDGFAGGFIYGYTKGWDLVKCCRLANACGAYLVTQPGCANFAPTLNQINHFIAERGGY